MRRQREAQLLEDPELVPWEHLRLENTSFSPSLAALKRRNAYFEGEKGKFRDLRPKFKTRGFELPVQLDPMYLPGGALGGRGSVRGS